MRTAFGFSVAFHVFLIFAVLYSAQLSLLLFKARQRQLQRLGEITVDLTYKPTDTPMKYGVQKHDLPPPLVNPKQEEEIVKEHSALSQAKEKLKKEKLPKEKKVKPIDKRKADLKSILEKIRHEVAKDDDRPPPKEKNFPTNIKGEKGALGTGGLGFRRPSPAEQALQSAMRKYFELEDANTFRKKYPNALGYLSLKLTGYGNQFRVVALNVVQSTGFRILDQRCEMAVHRAIDSESFASDIIAELSGKETLVECRP